MASGPELRRIASARLKTVNYLIKAEDWEVAAYMMGYVLETVLKAAACKALNLHEYPERTRIKDVDNCFMAHKFDQLLVISGLTSIFSFPGEPNPSKNYSEFVQEYPGDWVNMRYDPNVLLKFDKIKVTRLYQNLYDDQESIIKTVRSRRKW